MMHHPLLLPCFVHWTEEAGTTDPEDVLRLMSWRRTLTLKGSAFKTFQDRVIPLLDGHHAVPDICGAVADVFEPEDVIGALNMLVTQGVVVEGADATTPEVPELMKPHMGWLAENAPEGRAAQRRLDEAHVVIFGLGGAGGPTARALVTSGIGRLTLVDPSDVRAPDCAFSGLYNADDTGKSRSSVAQTALETLPTDCQITSHSARPGTAQEIATLIDTATLVLCCLDPGELNLALLLNQACHAKQIPWITTALEGTELLIGPGFFHTPGGPCYQCWRMREMATAANLSTRYAVETELARRADDLSHQRESLSASADIAGGMLAAEAITWLSGAAPPSLDGRFITLTLPGLRMEKHQVLRRPDCPVCGDAGAPI